MTRIARLSPALITSFTGGTEPIPGMPNGPFALPSGKTKKAAVHMQEVTSVDAVTSLSVGFVTTNSLVTLPFFIEIVPHSLLRLILAPMLLLRRFRHNPRGIIPRR